MTMPATEPPDNTILAPPRMKRWPRHGLFALPRLVMSLRGKLLLSYLVIILVGVLTLTVAADAIAPQLFRGMLSKLEPVPGIGSAHASALTATLTTTFHGAMLLALLIAATAALLTAIAASLYVSGRIVAPIQRMLVTSRRIAAGSYSVRVPVLTRDELGDLSASFNQMAEALAATERRRVELMGDIAHELRTPLTSIEGYMEGLLDGVIEPDEETFILIAREARRLWRLVDNLQELSRAESGQLPIVAHPVSLPELIQMVIARLMPQFQARQITLESALEREQDLMVMADEDRMSQILLNLLSNALRYTPENGHVRVSARREGNFAHVAVADSGIGLAAADLNRVFDRFYRVDKSRARSGGGSGIGLTVARALVEAQGGGIWAESAGLGQGSTFHFTLPCPGQYDK
jgi:signal transduction histidine kinase